MARNDRSRTRASEEAVQKDGVSNGLGDTVHKVLKVTKVDKVAKKLLGDDCGCQKRREKLNKIAPYKS